MTHARTLALLLMAALNAAAADYSIVDVQSVPLSGDPQKAVHRISVQEPVPETVCDVVIAGAGMGGIGAALAVARHDLNACVTEETDWPGGQATAGGVSALDENKFIEISGGTRRYYEFRNKIRQASGGLANPGGCYVSSLCFEPPVGVRVLESMLRHPRIKVFLRTQVLDVVRSGGRIESVLAWQYEKKAPIRLRLKYLLDATEMGDLLPLAKIPYVVGSEAKADTQEPHAAQQPNPACVQSFTYPFVIERRPTTEDHAIPKPPDYDAIAKRQQFTLKMNYPVEHGWRGSFEYRMYGDDPPIPNNMSPGPFFSWRRLRAATPELALMNWPRQDYAAESVLDRTPEDQARILQEAKRTSLSFLYWIQADLKHPEVRLRPDLMGTADGMSKYPYIRESRRMMAKGRVTEQDIVDEYWPGPRARWFEDSVGTGFYMVDIHPCGANERGRMMMPKPFQIPFSTLQPRESVNFLPAGKNIGVTHLTNGAFRLHPIEWMVGEAAGTAASLAIQRGGALPEVPALQTDLARAGVPLVWFDDLTVDHPHFAAVHLAAVRGLYPLGADLHASADAPITRTEAALALTRHFLQGQQSSRDNAAKTAVMRGWMAVDHRNWFHGDLPLLWTDIREDKLPSRLAPLAAPKPGPVRRGEFFSRLLGL